MDLIKKHKCVTGIIVIILLVALYYCWVNNWLYYYFDVVAKCSPAIAGGGAYYMWSKNRDYKNDYYKKILDKRIEAYEKINIFIEELAVQKDFCPVNSKFKSDSNTHFICFQSVEKLDKAIKMCVDIFKSKVWFSKDLNKYLLDIGEILKQSMTETNEYINDHNGNDTFLDEECNAYRYTMFVELKKHKEFSLCIDTVRSIIQEDFLGLGDIEAFLNLGQYNITTNTH